MSNQESPKLFRHAGFSGLFLSQLLGAFNDNLFKTVVSLLAVGAGGSQAGGYLSLVAGAFMLPYLLFSGYAGNIADMVEKRRVLVVVKSLEIVVMSMAFFALIAGRIDMLLVVLLLVATQAAFFSPAKYGILLEMLPPESLSNANGLLELGRYTAVIAGSALGGIVLAQWGSSPEYTGLLLVSVAVVGFMISLRISRVPTANKRRVFQLNPWREITSGARRLVQDRTLLAIVAGIGFIEFLGALVLMNTLLIGKETMQIGDIETTLLGAFAGCGIGIGSVFAGRLSRGKMALQFVVYGAFAIAGGLIVLSLTTGSYALFGVVLAFVGASGGFVLVPLNVALQYRADEAERGNIIATNKFFSMVAVLLSSIVLWFLHDLVAVSPPGILFLAGMMAVIPALMCPSVLQGRKSFAES